MDSAVTTAASTGTTPTTITSSMAVPTAPPAPVVEDDGSLSVAAGLAKEAAVLFQSGKLSECLKVLNQLLLKKENDPKVLHNIAIAETFQVGCLDPKKLLEVFENVKRRSEELARASAENVDGINSNGARNTVGSRGSTGNQYSSSPVVYADEFDTSVTMFNIAVIWFHLHEYTKAFSILDLLYQNIEPIDEGTALRICLLLLDVALISQHASRSADVISYLEKVFSFNGLINQAENGNSSQQQSGLFSKSVSLPNSSTTIDASGSDSAAIANTLESSLSNLSDEALEDESLQLLSSLDISGQNLSRPSSLQASNDFQRTQAEDSIPTIDLRLKLHLYKVQFLLLIRNLKAAKREVKMAMNTARGKDHSMALYLKSQLEYARGNHRKAIKLLMASSNRTETGNSSIYYNNLGCIFYRLGKYHTSSVFFSKALTNSSLLRKEKPLNLSTFSQDKSLQIIYNSGVQYLACGKPLLAARCFYKASLVFYNKPLLWLRIAECCLMALEKGLLNACAADSCKETDVRVHVVGKGKWRQLVVENGISRNGKINVGGREALLLGDGDKQLNLSMSLARQCLLNAFHLLSSSESKYSDNDLSSNSTPEENESRDTVPSKSTNYKNASGGDSKSSNVAVGSGQVNANGETKELKGGNSQGGSLQNSISDYEVICRKEKEMIKQAVLADLAFVELELGNPLKALSTARTLLKLPECSRIYMYLGNLYAAEALCLLNQAKEASEHLLMYVADGNSVELPYSQEDCEKWKVEKIIDSDESNGGPGATNTFLPDESQSFVFLKPEEARGTLYANLAVMSAMQGDLEMAQQFAMQALSIISNSPEAILTAIYVDLMRGKTDQALGKLRQCSRVRFVSGSLTSSSLC